MLKANTAWRLDAVEQNAISAVFGVGRGLLELEESHETGLN